MKLLALSFLFFMFSYAQAEQHVCDSVLLEQDINLKLNDIEKQFVCGSGKENGAWSNIPFSQARFHLRALLQTRGYLNPKFQVDENILRVDVGPLAKVKKAEPEGAPPQFHLGRRRTIIDTVLTPSKLNEIEGWTDEELKRLGYPCAEVSSEAFQETAEVIVHIKSGDRLRITDVKESSLDGLKKGVLRRYDAFKIGEFFSGQDITLSEKRAADDETGLVSSVSYKPICHSDGVTLEQVVVEGPPRSLAFGVGVNTEKGPLGRIRWRHKRLDERGSSLKTEITANLIEQRIQGSLTLYYLDNELSRHYLRPNIEIRREKDNKTETLARRFDILAGYNQDGFHNYWSIEGGPSLRQDRTVVGFGPADTTSTSLTGRFVIESHEFEYFRQAPQDGFKFEAMTDLNKKDWGSGFDAQKFEVIAENLWNLGYLSPPLIVLGVRVGLGSTNKGESDDIGALPKSYRYFLGGWENLRGFSRNELPGGDVGALSYGYLGVETRWIEVLPYKIEPFLFVDAGKLGTKALAFDETVYYSPGAGLRWQSPIGVFRGSIAQGLTKGPSDAENVPGRWQLYVSYGEEF